MLLPGRAVLLATDSQHVLLKLTQPSRNARRRAANGIPESRPDVLASPIRQLIHAHALVVEAVRIDGHPNSTERRDSVRAHTMATVDRRSRQLMKAERAQRWRTGTVGLGEIADLTSRQQLAEK